MKEQNMIPTVTTSHDATSWNVHRATLVELAHEVEQVSYVGVRGQRLVAMLVASYSEEARNLAADLCSLLRALPSDVAGPLLEDFKGPLDHAARGRHDLRPVGERGVENGAGQPVDITPLDETHRLDFLGDEREPGVGDLAAVPESELELETFTVDAEIVDELEPLRSDG